MAMLIAFVGCLQAGFPSDHPKAAETGFLRRLYGIAGRTIMARSDVYERADYGILGSER